MQHLIYFAFILFGATLFALLEIQIEGPHGWAANLPTWRIENRWTRLLYSNRPLTGYHLYLQLLILLLSHLPAAFFPHLWSWPLESKAIAFYILFFLLEDFLWFILNPAYGLKKFRKHQIPWHAPTWWLIAPRDYFLFGALGLFLYALATHYQQP